MKTVRIEMDQLYQDQVLEGTYTAKSQSEFLW